MLRLLGDDSGQAGDGVTDKIQAARKPHFRGDGVRHATIGGHRFHLRLSDRGGNHHLWIDGHQPPFVLDRTAADFIAHLIDAMWLYQRGNGDESQRVIDHVVDAMHAKYGRKRKNVTRERIPADLDRVFGTVMDLAKGGCPAEMGLGSKAIDYDVWTAPARMDLAVTYRCNLRCGKCYLPDHPQSDELGLDSWQRIYEILWKLGVPQVVSNTTLTKANGTDFGRTFAWLCDELGIRHIACNTLICSGKGVAYREEHALPDEQQGEPRSTHRRNSRDRLLPEMECH